MSTGWGRKSRGRLQTLFNSFNLFHLTNPFRRPFASWSVGPRDVPARSSFEPDSNPLISLICTLAVALSALPSISGASSIVVGWDACTDPFVTGYVLYYGPASRAYTNVLDVGKNLSVRIKGLNPHTTYYFSVRSYSGFGVQSVDSAEVACFIPVPGGDMSSPLSPTRAWNLWWEDTSGNVGHWSMTGSNCVLAALTTPSNVGLDWKVAATGDLDADGQEDLLFQNGDGRAAAWLMDGANLKRGDYLVPDTVHPAWRLAASGDFLGTGQKGLVWQCNDGHVGLWFMDGLTRTQALVLSTTWPDTGWQVVGTGDFNGDGQTDILFQNLDGRISTWLMSGTNWLQTVPLSPAQVDPAWRVAGTIDLNGDGHTGLLWQHQSGEVGYWLMDDTTCIGAGNFVPANVGPAWRIVGPK